MSVKLKKFKNVDGSSVEMLLLPPAGTTGELPFALSFGDYTSEQLTVPFTLKESGTSNQSIFDFSRTFLSPTGVPFTLHKTYVFDKDEYLFELRVAIQNSVNDFPSLNFGGFAYTLTLGPQIGPHYLKLDGRNDYRNYAYWAEGKRQDPGVKMGATKELEKDFTWTAVVGKYFTAIAQPVGTAYHVVFDSRQLVPGFDRSTISFERPPLQSPKTTDTFRFYLGPMKTEILALLQRQVEEPVRHLGAACRQGGHLLDSHRVAGHPDEVHPGLLLSSHPQLRHCHHPADAGHQARVSAR